MLNRRLTRTVNLEDFILSETAHRLGLNNWPQDAVIEQNLLNLAVHILEPVGQHFETRPMISSGYRNAALNKAVGGMDNSQHLTGQAVDFQVPGISELEVARWMAANLDFDQLLLERMERAGEKIAWIHCSYVSYVGNRHEVKHGSGSSFTDGLPEAWP